MARQGNAEEYCQHSWSEAMSEQNFSGSISGSLNAVSKKCSNSKKIYVTKTPPKAAIKNRGTGPLSQPKKPYYRHLLSKNYVTYDHKRKFCA